MRILRDAGGTITLRTYDSAGAPADVDGTNAPTVVVVNSAGEAVPGFAGRRDGVGIYSADVPGDMETLDTYSVTWTWPNGQSRRSSFDLVGGFLFSIAELRAFDPVLADEVKYPADSIRGVRDVVEDRFAAATGIAFAPRGGRAWLSGRGGRKLVLPDRDARVLVRIRVDGVALSPDEMARVHLHPYGVLEREGGVWPPGVRNVEVLYERGFPEPPTPVKRAGLRYAKHLLVSSPYDDRATAMFTDAGGFRLTVAGRDGPTGLPEVDAVLREYAAPGGLA